MLYLSYKLAVGSDGGPNKVLFLLTGPTLRAKWRPRTLVLLATGGGGSECDVVAF